MTGTLPALTPANQAPVEGAAYDEMKAAYDDQLVATGRPPAAVRLVPAVAPPNAANMVTVKVEQRVKEYIKTRDAIKAANEAHEASIKPLVELQNLLTGWLQNFMEQAGADNIKTSEGTCYHSTRYTASLADPEAFMQYVISKQQYDLLDRKANVTAVKDYVAENNALPPGVNLSAIKTVGVRRASGK